jgi:hypothetical protein
MSISLFLLLIVLVIVFGFCSGRLLREGVMGRVMPEPLRHPGGSSVNVMPGTSGNYNGSGLNDWVDGTMDFYFDGDGYPFQDTRQQFLSIFVEPFQQHSVITKKTQSRLTDVGYYLIRHVLPQLAANLGQQSQWPPMVWTDDLSLVPSNIWGNDNGGAQNGLVSIKSSETGIVYNKSPAAAASSSAAATTSGSSNPAAGGGSGSDGSSGGNTTCSVTEACGQPCPSSCIDAALMALKSSPAAAVDVSSPTKLSSNLNPTEFGEWWSLFTDSSPESALAPSPARSSSSNNKKASIRVPKVDHIPVTPEYDSKLDDYLNKNYLDFYFDATTGIPTKNFVETFTAYTQGQNPMDQAHMNKASDMIYYVLETLVAGFPTKRKPAFDFTWKRIARLSSREFVL